MKANHNRSKIHNHREEKPKRAGSVVLGHTLDDALDREGRHFQTDHTNLQNILRQEVVITAFS